MREVVRTRALVPRSHSVETGLPVAASSRYHACVTPGRHRAADWGKRRFLCLAGVIIAPIQYNLKWSYDEPAGRGQGVSARG